MHLFEIFTFLRSKILAKPISLSMCINLLRSAFIFFLPAFVSAQSLSIKTVGNTANNNVSTFSLAEGKVVINTNQITFLNSRSTFNAYLAYGISPDLSVLGLLTKEAGESSALVLNSTGNILSKSEITSLSSGDPSIAVYPANTGAVLVRDNIANFNFYDSFGEIMANLSGSSQSKGGEVISEVAMNPAAETVVIYTPKIKRGNKMGSQAQYVDNKMNLKGLFFSTDRYIKNVSVTNNGQFVVFITSGDETNDEIHVTDRYGNELAIISPDENLKGAKLSENAGYITAFSGKRVLIFNTMTGKRTGSTSFRSEVIEVNYFPQDQTILAMTGDYTESTGIINNVEFHAIDIQRRKVDRKEYNAPLGLDKALHPRFIRLGNNRYQLAGANKNLELRVSF